MSFNSRHFNKLILSDDGTTIIKSSNNDNLAHEINYYKKIYSDHLNLVKYYPEFISGKCIDNNFELKLEYKKFPTLSELFVTEYFQYKDIKTIFRNIEIYISDLEHIKSKKEGMHVQARCNQIYVKKNLDRINQFKNSNIYKEKLNYDKLIVNGVPLRSLDDIIEKTIPIMQDIGYDYEYLTAIHGDLCFSNILIDPNTKNLFFIDPRGNFGHNNSSIFGDSLYDVAKLAHSCIGNYDFIIHDLYTMNHIERNKFEFHILPSGNPKDFHGLFNKRFVIFSKKIDYSRTLYMIMGWLFLSMLPLHCDDENRQIALYIRGLQIMTEVMVEYNI